eukprot:12618832-Heterocapsa_arctica.AAC.1
MVSSIRASRPGRSNSERQPGPCTLPDHCRVANVEHTRRHRAQQEGGVEESICRPTIPYQANRVALLLDKEW